MWQVYVYVPAVANVRVIDTFVLLPAMSAGAPVCCVKEDVVRHRPKRERHGFADVHGQLRCVAHERGGDPNACRPRRLQDLYVRGHFKGAPTGRCRPPWEQAAPLWQREACGSNTRRAEEVATIHGRGDNVPRGSIPAQLVEDDDQAGPNPTTSTPCYCARASGSMPRSESNDAPTAATTAVLRLSPAS